MPASSDFFRRLSAERSAFMACRSTRTLFWVFAFVTITLVVAFRLKWSSLGRAMISVREDEFAAQAMGVNVARVKVLAFMMAAFFAGMAGGLLLTKAASSSARRTLGFSDRSTTC